MKSYDETPWWCQLLWPRVGPPWYAEIEDPAAWLAAIRRQFAQRAGELADDLAGDDRPGEGYLAKAGRLTAARYQAEEIIRHEYGPLPSDDADAGDEDDAPASAGERPAVIGRDYPSWAEVGCRAAGTDRRSRVGLAPASVRVPGVIRYGRVGFESA
jgi:hypothetical protein